MARQTRKPDTPSKVTPCHRGIISQKDNTDKVPTDASGPKAEDGDAKQTRQAQGYGPGSGVGA